jgi:hypothetical protein
VIQILLVIVGPGLARSILRGASWRPNDGAMRTVTIYKYMLLNTGEPRVTCRWRIRDDLTKGLWLTPQPSIHSGSRTSCKAKWPARVTQAADAAAFLVGLFWRGAFIGPTLFSRTNSRPCRMIWATAQGVPGSQKRSRRSEV